jgi:hypothetical protein
VASVIIRKDALSDPRLGWQFWAVDKLGRAIAWPAPQFARTKDTRCAGFHHPAGKSHA